MKLDVLRSKEPWYAADGLSFTCTQCGNCCTGGPGYVWLSADEIGRLAGFLNLEPQAMVDKYCRQIGNRFSLKEVRVARGQYDCIFLKDIGSGKRGCAIYPVRPLQCRTWPFWDGNIHDADAWEQTAEKCPGINRGRKYSREQIEAIRDAADWPDNPPTSA